MSFTVGREFGRLPVPSNSGDVGRQLEMREDRRRHTQQAFTDSNGHELRDPPSSLRRERAPPWRPPDFRQTAAKGPLAMGPLRRAAAAAAAVLLLQSAALVDAATKRSADLLFAGPGPHPVVQDSGGHPSSLERRPSFGGLPPSSLRSWDASVPPRASAHLEGPLLRAVFGGHWRLLSLVSPFVSNRYQESLLDLPFFVQCLFSVSFVCLLGCLLAFLWLFLRHLSNYYEPKLQRMICRIGCAMPFFAILSSAASLSVLSELGPALEEPYELSSRMSLSNTLALKWAGTSAEIAAAAAATAGGVLMEASGGIGSPLHAEAQAVGDTTGEGTLPALDAPLRELSAVGEAAVRGVGGLRDLFSEDSLRNALLDSPERHFPVSPGIKETASQGSREGLEEGPHLLKGGFFRESYYVQQQLFFELGKQLAQSMALYSFSSLMINICGEGKSPSP